MGSSSQYSTEIVESNHRTMAKDPYHATNRKDYATQMCRALDRDDRIAYLKELIEWDKTQQSMEDLEATFKEYSPRYKLRAIANFEEARKDPKEQQRVRSRYKTSRLWLAERPLASSVEVEVVADEYRLPNLQQHIARFFQRSLSVEGIPTLDQAIRQLRIVCLDVWSKLTIRMPNVQDEDICSITHSVEAVAPSQSLPHGRCH